MPIAPTVALTTKLVCADPPPLFLGDDTTFTSGDEVGKSPEGCGVGIGYVGEWVGRLVGTNVGTIVGLLVMAMDDIEVVSNIPVVFETALVNALDFNAVTSSVLSAAAVTAVVVDMST